MIDTISAYPLSGIRHIAFNPVAPTNMVRALASVAKEESTSGVREFRVPDKDSLTALAESSSGDIRYRFSIKKVCMHCRDDTGRGNQPHQMI